MIRLRCGEDIREAEVLSTREGVRVVVDGAALAVDVQAVGPDTYVWRQGLEHETFQCVRAGQAIHIFWKGTAYSLQEVSEDERTLQRHQVHALRAPMPGRVIALRVQPGQAVSRGQEILVVEAMKMENAIRAPEDGVVKSIAARVGDMVSAGVVLVELE